MITSYNRVNRSKLFLVVVVVVAFVDVLETLVVVAVVHIFLDN